MNLWSPCSAWQKIIVVGIVDGSNVQVDIELHIFLSTVMHLQYKVTSVSSLQSINSSKILTTLSSLAFIIKPIRQSSNLSFIFNYDFIDHSNSNEVRTRDRHTYLTMVCHVCMWATPPLLGVAHLFIYQSINQSINQSIDWSINHQINQSFWQSINRSIVYYFLHHF